MSSIRLLSAASAALILAAACAPDEPGANPSGPSASVQAGVHRQYGTPTKVGNGMVRTYVVLDEKDGRTPLEVGVAFTEDAMEGLPAPVPGGMGHEHSPVYLLDLPAQNPTPYRFVELDWNPAGHEPETVYTFPHFDFHFYVVSKEFRAGIVPSDPQYATKAANLPAPEYRAPFYIDASTAAGGAPAEAVAVPMMGIHWLDVRSPELQKLTGHPELYRDFTATFIYGSWDGQFIFDEPMITRAFILSKKAATDPAERDQIIPISTANRYAPAGYYPSAYRITYDEQAKEYRVALTQLTWHD
jgi:hypothetical protein